MVRFEIINPVISDMSESEVKEHLTILLSLESDEEKLTYINTLIKRIGKKLANNK